MASFRKRKNRLQVTIGSGSSRVTKTFDTKTEANRWVASMKDKPRQQNEVYEMATRQTVPQEITRHRPKTLAEVLDHYAAVVVPVHKAAKHERYYVSAIKKEVWANIPLENLTLKHLSEWRDRRLVRVSTTTVHLHYGLIRQAIKAATQEWDWYIPNAKELISLKIGDKGIPNIERVTPEKFNKLLKEAEASKNPFMKPMTILALHTAIRKGELLALTWQNIYWDDHIIRLTRTKNKSERSIPLTVEAEEALRTLQALAIEGQTAVIPITDNAHRLSWSRIRKRAKVHVRFHDLRHESISRFFERGLTIPEVQSISGHKTLEQLNRYSHAMTAKQLVHKIRSAA